MRLEPWRALGKGSLLGALRSDLRRATGDVLVVGPWIDDYFAQELAAVCPASVRLRVLSRPLEQVSEGFAPHAIAAASIFAGRPNTEQRHLAGLHAKVVVLDDATVYCGSTNFYRFSLESGLELTLRGPAREVPSLLDELASWWNQAEMLTAPTVTADSGAPGHSPTPPKGYVDEVVDPLAASVLASVPGSFVVGRRRR